jgi:hypothetical protein
MFNFERTIPSAEEKIYPDIGVGTWSRKLDQTPASASRIFSSVPGNNLSGNRPEARLEL